MFRTTRFLLLATRSLGARDRKGNPRGAGWAETATALNVYFWVFFLDTSRVHRRAPFRGRRGGAFDRPAASLFGVAKKGTQPMSFPDACEEVLLDEEVLL